ncbi:MAG: hypothetical protein ACK5JU_05835 [Bacteroidales bacterium]
MRRFLGLFIVSLLFTSILFTGCNDKDKVVWVQTNMPDSAYFKRQGDSISFKLQSNGLWDFYNKGRSWIKIKPSVPVNPDKTDTTVWIVVDENLSRFERRDTFYLKWGSNLESNKSIIIKQERGPERLLPLRSTEVQIPFDEERIFIGFSSNVHFTITDLPDWMSHVPGDFYYRKYDECDPTQPFSSCQMVKCDSTIGTNIYALFTFNPNITTTSSRTGTIKAKWEDGELSTSVNVLQRGVEADYFELLPVVTPYEMVKSGLNAGDLLTREITARSVYTEFEYSLTDPNDNPVTWATFTPAPTRSPSVTNTKYTLEFETNNTGTNRGVILRVWPKSNPDLGQSLQFLQLK